MTLSKSYKQLLAQKHTEEPNYGRSGKQHAKVVFDLMQMLNISSMLDYGCGKGDLARMVSADIGNAARKDTVTFAWYDPAIPEYATKPEDQFDLVTCTDVLEHVEPDFLLDVLHEINFYSLRFAYLVVHTGPAVHKLPDGRNAHLIQQPIDWWVELISCYFLLSPLSVVKVGEYDYSISCIPKALTLEDLEKAEKLILQLVDAEVEQDAPQKKLSVKPMWF